MTGNKFVVDSWAWIEYFDGSEAGGKIRKYIEDEKNAVFTSSVTVAEVVSKFLRKRMDPHQAFNGINIMSKIIPADAELAVFSGELHAEIKQSVRDFGLADSFVLATAKKQNAKILTGDPHFKGFKEAVLFNK